MKCSFLKLIITLILTLNLVLSSPTSKKRELKLSKHPVLLVVSYDGFRYDYMTKTDTPNLDSIMGEGSSVPFMRAQFPTSTFPNHHSISTGLYPDSHGVTDNVVFDPLYGEELNGFDDVAGFWNFSSEVQPIWLRNEDAGDERYSGCYMWPGSSQGYGENSDQFATYYIPTYNGSIPWESRVDTAISWITNEEQPANLVFLYYNEPDSKGHYYGTDDPVTITEIQKTDNRTGVLIQKLRDAGIYDEINLIILSDHGMQTVREENVIDISNAISDSSSYDRYGATPLIYIQPRASVNLEDIYLELKAEADLKNFSVFKKEEMRDLNFFSNRRITDLIVLADPGFGFEDMNFNTDGNHGVHGYDNRNQNMSAFFVARGPLFKKGFEAEDFIQNIDLFPLISYIMDFQEVPNNGSLNGISNLLVNFGME